jgi:hypothetical protein
MWLLVDGRMNTELFVIHQDQVGSEEVFPRQNFLIVSRFMWAFL